MAFSLLLTLKSSYGTLAISYQTTIPFLIMTDTIHTKLTEGRRVAIPAVICQELGLRPGDPLVLEVANRAIILRSLDDVVREVQAYFADVAPPNVVLSDELSRDRRAEAARDKP